MFRCYTRGSQKVLSLDITHIFFGEKMLQALAAHSY